jgi:hypothetical protein
MNAYQKTAPYYEFSTIGYGARTWERPHRVIVIAEHIAKGANPRLDSATMGCLRVGLPWWSRQFG